jgi:hypothetical protein
VTVAADDEERIVVVAAELADQMPAEDAVKINKNYFS